jgi:proline racemase
VSAPSRILRIDLAYGGAFYAIADSEAAGVPIDGSRDAEVRRIARALSETIERTERLIHPALPDIDGLRGVVFTAPAQHEGADFRIVAVTSNGRISRGTSGTGLAAVLAVLDAMGLPIDEQGVTLEGGVGSRLHGRIEQRAQIGDYDAIVPVVRGTAWILGEHTFMAAADDPLAAGFLYD